MMGHTNQENLIKAERHLREAEERLQQARADVDAARQVVNSARRVVDAELPRVRVCSALVVIGLANGSSEWVVVSAKRDCIKARLPASDMTEVFRPVEVGDVRGAGRWCTARRGPVGHYYYITREEADRVLFETSKDTDS